MTENSRYDEERLAALLRAVPPRADRGSRARAARCRLRAGLAPARRAPPPPLFRRLTRLSSLEGERSPNRVAEDSPAWARICLPLLERTLNDDLLDHRRCS